MPGWWHSGTTVYDMPLLQALCHGSRWLSWPLACPPLSGYLLSLFSSENLPAAPGMQELLWVSDAHLHVQPSPRSWLPTRLAIPSQMAALLVWEANSGGPK